MKRVLTALVLIPLVTAAVFYAPALVVTAALAAVALLCLREFYEIAERSGMRPFQIAGHGAALALIFAGRLPEPAFLMGFAAILLVLSLQGPRKLEDSLGSVASTLLGVTYIGGSMALARDLHAANPHWLFFPMVLNWFGDSAAYYGGRALGRRPLAPRISPKKTWEGTFASAIFAISAGVAYLIYFQPDELLLLEAFGLAASVNVASQLGDLAESALKRGAEVKDSGDLLPGHGGMLDRVDGLLFSFPAVYFCLMALGNL